MGKLAPKATDEVTPRSGNINGFIAFSTSSTNVRWSPFPIKGKAFGFVDPEASPRRKILQKIIPKMPFLSGHVLSQNL